jgi:hypothetical protein
MEKLMEQANESTDGLAAQGRGRIDWRTGKPMVQRGAAFWREQERRRLELGLSVPQYCAANGLALSTYRHQVSGKKRAGAKKSGESKPAPSSPTFVAVASALSDSPAAIEVALEGMMLRLCGAACERVLDRIMGRLA